MSQPANPDEVRSALDPVWFNTYWIKNALGLYEGVSKHADQLNLNYGHFFGLVQKISLDHAVLGLCKLFDKSNPTYQKDTIPELFFYLRERLTGSYVVRLKIEMLTTLGIPQEVANQLLTGLQTAFDATRDTFIQIMEKFLSNLQEDAALKQLLLYRNKMLAHQERLNEALKEQLTSLPSIHAMEQLNNWAINFCLLAIHLLTPNISLIPDGRSARIAALNVAAKVLDKKFDDHAEYKSFFALI